LSLRIVSRSAEPFKDRFEAGQILGEELKRLDGKNAVVLGIPRGGLIVASEVAHSLNVKLDVVLAHKIGAPGNPEFAIGALCEDGFEFIDEYNALQAGADKQYINEIKAKLLEALEGRKMFYRKVCPKISLEQRVVVLIDDGLATGATVQAALWSIRREKPKSILAAFPVASMDGLKRISGYADQVFCLRAPDYFSAVGQFYLKFPEVTDKEVINILDRNKRVAQEST